MNVLKHQKYGCSPRALLLVLITAVAVTLNPGSVTASSEQSQISIEVGEGVKISGIDDWLIGVFTATSSIFNIQYNWDYECVYSSSGAYRVELVSQNGTSPLTLETASGDQMQYEVWSYYRRGGGYTLDGPYTSPNFSINNLSASQFVSCDDELYGGNNLFFAALVRPGPFNAAPPGIYQDLVTLMVSPE